jgi:pimeloyl-ACP methyl ester carboxylesterase
VAHSFGSAAINVALREIPFTGRLVYLSPPEDFRFFTLSFASMLGIPEGLALSMEAELERQFNIRWSQLRGAALAPGMTAPLLVIHDEDDEDVPVRYGRALAEAWPGAELMVTSGLGHRRILRDAATIAATISFLGREDDESGVLPFGHVLHRNHQ